MHIGVEDGQSETYTLVTAVVSPHMTIAQLKEQVPVTKQVSSVLLFERPQKLSVLFNLFNLLSTIIQLYHWFNDWKLLLEHNIQALKS